MSPRGAWEQVAARVILQAVPFRVSGSLSNARAGFFLNLHLECILSHCVSMSTSRRDLLRQPGRIEWVTPVHLTQFSDYSLRLAIYLACHAEQTVSVDAISRAFGISRHHLVKVVQTLTELGVVESQRGRGGGMRLAIRPSEINVGWLVRRTEPHFNLVECFDLAGEYLPDRTGLRIEGSTPSRRASLPERPGRVQPGTVPHPTGRTGPPAGRLAPTRSDFQSHGLLMSDPTR